MLKTTRDVKIAIAVFIAATIASTVMSTCFMTREIIINRRATLENYQEIIAIKANIERASKGVSVCVE